MVRERLASLAVLWLILLLAAACGAEPGPAGPVGPAGVAGPEGPPGPAGEAASASQAYVGAETCGNCHEDQFARFQLSGHPHQLTAVTGGQPPVYPYDDVTGGLAEPPAGTTWDDVSYVVGGYGWRALFLDQDGYLITGDSSQYNFANEAADLEAGWAAYHPGEELPYDCGGCHTTGYRPQGHQDGLPGIEGEWAFAGVQCEACHGPGSRHAEDPAGVAMVVEDSARLCGSCHARGDKASIEADAGFARNHQQFNDLHNTKHLALDCVDCHDPHASTLYADEEVNPAGGLRQQCDTCHWQNRQQNVRLHLGVDCVDCHMPLLALSAQGDPAQFTGDIHAHQFAINPDAEAVQFSEDGSLVAPYLTLATACQHCHNGEFATEKDLATLSQAAQVYHDQPTPTPEPSPTPTPAETPAGDGETTGATPTPEG